MGCPIFSTKIIKVSPGKGMFQKFDVKPNACQIWPKLSNSVKEKKHWQRILVGPWYKDPMLV
jgi:hypothetical protein